MNFQHSVISFTISILLSALLLTCKNSEDKPENAEKIETEILNALNKDSIEMANTKAVYQTDLFKEQLNGKVKKTITSYFNDDEKVKNRKNYRKEIKLYNQSGFITESFAYDSENTLFEKKTYEYDELKLIKVAINDTLFENYVYNERNGQLKEIIPSTNKKSIITYNEQGLVCVIENPADQYIFKYYYDSLGHLVKEEWYEKFTKLFTTDTYTYDDKGQLLHAELSLGEVVNSPVRRNGYNSSVYEYEIQKNDPNKNWTKRIKTIKANGIGYQYHERIIQYY